VKAEARYEEASNKLAKSILARYHEEQIWSDKIRQMSTWGTWGLMGLNVLLFIVFQIMIEPWRRRRAGPRVRGHSAGGIEWCRQARHEDAMAASVKVEDASLSGALVTLVVDGVMGASESRWRCCEEEAAFEKIVNAEVEG